MKKWSVHTSPPLLFLYCNIQVTRKLGAGTKYLFQDLHGKYFPRLSTLNLPHLEDLKEHFIIIWCFIVSFPYRQLLSWHLVYNICGLSNFMNSWNIIKDTWTRGCKSSGSVDCFLIRMSVVWSPPPLGSKCPWAKYCTPNCFWCVSVWVWAGWQCEATLLLVFECVCVNE